MSECIQDTANNKYLTITLKNLLTQNLISKHLGDWFSSVVYHSLDIAHTCMVESYYLKHHRKTKIVQIIQVWVKDTCSCELQSESKGGGGTRTLCQTRWLKKTEIKLPAIMVSIGVIKLTFKVTGT